MVVLIGGVGRLRVGWTVDSSTHVSGEVRKTHPPGSLPSVDHPGAGTPQALQERKGMYMLCVLCTCMVL